MLYKSPFGKAKMPNRSQVPLPKSRLRVRLLEVNSNTPEEIQRRVARLIRGVVLIAVKSTPFRFWPEAVPVVLHTASKCAAVSPPCSLKSLWAAKSSAVVKAESVASFYGKKQRPKYQPKRPVRRGIFPYDGMFLCEIESLKNTHPIF